MILKRLLLLTTCLIITGECGLLRTPKVYNALISSDDNLTPSRAYPVVQPEITYPFAPFPSFGLYNSYASYPSILSSSQPQLQGRNQFYSPKNPVPPLPQEPIEAEPVPIPQEKANLEQPPQPIEIPEPNNSLVPKQTPHINPIQPKSPIPLNEYGLPPSLLPLTHSFGSNSNLQYNPYSSFPVLYDSLNGYNPSQFSLLQPYGYIPQFSHPNNPYYATNTIPQPQNNIDTQYRNGRVQQETTAAPVAPQVPTTGPLPTPAPEPQQSPSVEPEQIVEQIPEAIKNHANKNKDIPDVPPPPIPSGAKTQEN